MTDLAVQDLYETDYYAWAMQQADAIERLLQAGSNVPLDLFHLADEVRLRPEPKGQYAARYGGS